MPISSGVKGNVSQGEKKEFS